jgi:hypothetical protein
MTSSPKYHYLAKPRPQCAWDKLHRQPTRQENRTSFMIKLLVNLSVDVKTQVPVDLPLLLRQGQGYKSCLLAAPFLPCYYEMTVAIFRQAVSCMQMTSKRTNLVFQSRRRSRRGHYFLPCWCYRFQPSLSPNIVAKSFCDCVHKIIWEV